MYVVSNMCILYFIILGGQAKLSDVSQETRQHVYMLMLFLPFFPWLLLAIRSSTLISLLHCILEQVQLLFYCTKTRRFGLIWFGYFDDDSFRFFRVWTLFHLKFGGFCEFVESSKTKTPILKNWKHQPSKQY